MGRLFWKFFFFFMLAQVTTVLAVSSAIWLRHRAEAAQAELREAPPPGAPAGAFAPQDRGPGAGADAGGRDGLRHRGLLFPVEPIIGGVLASLAFAALLAWYVSKPIRSLRKSTRRWTASSAKRCGWTPWWTSC